MSHSKLCQQCGATLPDDAPQGLCPACLVKVGIDPDTQHAYGETQTSASPTSSLPAPAEIATHFPQLEILSILGHGGMGIVYKARQTKLDRVVALKILPSETAKDPAFAERFSREARTLARLNHPNIVAIYDFGEADGLYYFIMEYVDGISLRQMETSQSLTPQAALKIVPSICDALQYAHDEGIVHRDIKPGNILIDQRGRVKIADFGLAKLLGKASPDLTLTQSHHVMGTPHYMAPEQTEHPLDVDHRADIYSLGVVFYEMLTGELPIGRFEPPSSRTGSVKVDVRLDEVVLRTLEKEPERRYQQASQLKTDVETIANTDPPYLPGTPKHSRGTSGRSPRELVHPPSVGLLVSAIFHLLSAGLPLVFSFLRSIRSTFPMPIHLESLPVFGVFSFSFSGLLTVACAILVIIGAGHLRRLESYGWALTASILALISAGPLWILSCAMGVWALVILFKPEVKAAFTSERSRAT